MTVASHSVKQAFERSAKEYDAFARLQRYTLEDAVHMVRYIFPERGMVLDAGCGTGYLKDYIDREKISWRLEGCDIARNMCDLASRKMPVKQCSIESLMFEDQSFDAVFSSLTMQWVEKVEEAFREVYRVLKPGGYTMVTTYGTDTLWELREAFSTIDGLPHVIEFSELDYLLKCAGDAGFNIQLSKKATETYYYPNLQALLDMLRGLGATNKHVKRHKGLTGVHTFAMMEQEYERRHLNPSGLPATWDVYFILLKRSS